MIYTITLNPAVDRELTVDRFAYNSVLRATSWQVDYGGKGFNVSRMLLRLGAPSVALAFAGGKSGELLHDGLAALGITTSFVPVPDETRTNVSIVSETEDKYIKVNEPGPTITSAAQRAMLARIQALASPGDWWVLAGSLPPGVPANFYARIITLLREAGARPVLDSSGEPLRTGTQAAPELVKPNDVELRELTGMPTDTLPQILEAARAMQEVSLRQSTLAPAVVVSLGSRGALAVPPPDSDQDISLVHAPVITERNPTGAGDSLVAGLIWGLERQLPLAEALTWGVACGAAAASISGTGLGTREQVRALRQATRIEKLSTMPQ